MPGKFRAKVGNSNTREAPLVPGGSVRSCCSMERGVIRSLWGRRRQGNGDCLRFASLPELAGQVEEFLAALFASDHDARQDAMDQGPEERLVAASDLSCDDSWPQHAFGLVVGRRHFRMKQEGQPFRHVFLDMVRKTLEISARIGRQSHQPVDQAVFHLVGLPLIIGVRHTLAAFRQRDGVLNQLGNPVVMRLFAWRGCLTFFFGPAQQMSVALPFLVVEDIVTAIAVDHDEAVEVRAEDVAGHSMTAAPLPERMA